MRQPLRLILPVAIALLPALLVPETRSDEPSVAQPTVTKAREADDPDLPQPDPDLVGEGDDPDARNKWYVDQRIYPFDSIPSDGLENAAREYLRRREDMRLRYLHSLTGDTPAPLGPIPTGPWSEAGPAPISPSTLSFGNVAGRISTVAVHPTNSNIILIGASRGGIWRTTNGGTTWTPVADDQTTLAIADIEFAPSNPQIVYAGTGDDDIGFWGAGILKSFDGGVTWFRIDNGSDESGIVNGSIISKIAVDPTDPNKVVAASAVFTLPNGQASLGKIYYTTNGGSTWHKATIPHFDSPGGHFRSLVMEKGCPSHLWAVNNNWYQDENAIYHSVDGGANWTKPAAAGLPRFGINTQLAVQHSSCSGPATLYVSAYLKDHTAKESYTLNLAGTANYPGFFRSTDDGATFLRPGAPGPVGGCLGQCGYDHGLLVDPTTAGRVYMVGRDFWTSENSGASWTNRSGCFTNADVYMVGVIHSDLHDMAISGSGSSAVIYIASDGGLWSYDVATLTFTNRNGNLAISEITDLALDPDTPSRGIAGLQDNGVIVYAGTPQWPQRNSGDGGPSGWLKVTPGDGNPFDGGFSTYIGNTAYKSTNSGASFSTWTGDGNFPRDTDPYHETAEFYGPWVATPGNNRVWHGAESLWYCDFPSNCYPWQKYGTTNVAALTGSVFMSKLAINNPAPGVFGPFYAANAYPRAFLQSDNGLTWNVRTGTLPDRYISKIVFDPISPSKVWVTLSGFASGHIFYSADGGTTWVDKSGDLPNVPVNTILLDPEDRANVWYIGTDAGIYATSNGSAAAPTWTSVGYGLPVVQVSDLELDQNRLLYASTGGRSVWTISLPSSPACAAAINNGPVCLGGTLILSAAPLAGATYSWIGPNGFTSNFEVPQIPNVTAAAAGVYAVTTTLGGVSCTTLTTVTIGAPVATPITAASTGSICEGSTLSLSASTVSGATFYVWSGPNGFNSVLQNPTIPNAGPAASGTYQVYAFVSGCATTPATTIATVIPQNCDDMLACTTGDTCGIPPASFTELFDGVTTPAIPGGWVVTIAPPSGTPWVTTSTASVSTPNSAMVLAPATTSDKTLDSPTFTPNVGAALEFDNGYNLSFHRDGAVLEIKIGDGPYTDIVQAGGTFVSGAYNGVIDPPCPSCNPSYSSAITGRAAWSGASNGFIHTKIKLPTAAFGQPVSLRFRVVTDDFGGAVGTNAQWIDSVQVTYDQAACLPGPTPVVCPPSTDACHLDGVCDPLAGCVNPPAATLTPCDDGDTCSLGDVCNGYGTCEPGFRAPAPPQADGLSLTKTVLSWPPVSGATSYDVVKGSLGSLRSTGGNYQTSVDGCSAQSLPSTSLDISAELPAPGTGTFFLARAVDCSGPGTYDESVPDQVAARDAGIQAAASTCGVSCTAGRCVQGPAFTGACASDACVQQICTLDPFCCYTAWDDICVSEVRTICSSLSCSDSTGACTHSLCSEGAALTSGCDDPPVDPSCAASICTTDPFCCNTAWDNICVLEVQSVCGYGCQ